MTISFIVTTYNVLPYVDRCLESLAAIGQAGDEVIIVDDGSTDGTAEQVAEAGNDLFATTGLRFQPILLGTNTMGGVGIGANIGMREARSDTVFFVDGDDWINVEGFQRARACWESRELDILVTNYLEHDERTGAAREPADSQKWHLLDPGLPLRQNRLQALSLIAVPWRKFYRRGLLEEHGLAFPEGDFFFEDNPFHWAVCLAAERIDYLDVTICHHRINRPGQTMVSNGAELAAFFQHFRTIRAFLPADDPELHTALALWILGNMSWHLGRLAKVARLTYLQDAAEALKLIDDAIWNGPVRERLGQTRSWQMGSRLRAGDVWGVMDQWVTDEFRGEMERMYKDLCRKLDNLGAAHKGVGDGVRKQAEAIDSVRTRLQGLIAAERFRALKAL